MNPFLLTDGYKTSHHSMYPEGTTLVYDNFTPRSNKHAPKGCDKVLVIGTSMLWQKIDAYFNKGFFSKPKEEVCAEIKKEYSMYLGYDYDVSHIEALHDYGKLPVIVKALQEGTLCPMGVPMMTLYNTDPRFFWVPNFLETIISNLAWQPMTSATLALQYRKILTKYALETDKDNLGAVDFQAHDFSMRGMSGLDSTIGSSLGHAAVFLGSDSLPVIHAARKYYHETEGVVYSVPATEHSVMCAGGKEDEIETFRRLLKTYPKGILSVVSDTWDLWKVCTEILPALKEEILARDGKLVIRPDSGDPVDIICGIHSDILDHRGRKGDPSEKGVIELLWDIFGGTENEQGYKVLDPHIGAIYGDSITISRAEQICERLKDKGFASTNIVLGVGSFTYQYNTRDTFGFAMKATYCEVLKFPETLEQAFSNDDVRKIPFDITNKAHVNLVKGTYLKTRGEHLVEGREIFKDPITDDGTKKSAKGLLRVDSGGKMIVGGDSYTLTDQVSWEEEGKGALQIIYKEGEFFNQPTLTEIREKVKQLV